MAIEVTLLGLDSIRVVFYFYTNRQYVNVEGVVGVEPTIVRLKGECLTKLALPPYEKRSLCPLLKSIDDQNKGLTFGFASLRCEHGNNPSHDEYSSGRYHGGSVLWVGYEALNFLELLVHIVIIPNQRFCVKYIFRG